ncbi:MAG: EutN/CcmL family microcompartment protein [Candidatus Atribacteria bacterium]|nr:EutN/CcmL family microcompartment protein [Candidatus Atribacteria bacterium]
MILAKVIGHVVSTIKLSIFKGFKLLLVQPVDADGKPKGKVLLVLDTVQAGIGDMVLVMDEGNSARTIVGDSFAPIRSLVVGIVDEVRLTGENKDEA